MAATLICWKCRNRLSMSVCTFSLGRPWKLLVWTVAISNSVRSMSAKVSLLIFQLGYLENSVSHWNFVSNCVQSWNSTRPTSGLDSRRLEIWHRSMTVDIGILNSSWATLKPVGSLRNCVPIYLQPCDITTSDLDGCHLKIRSVNVNWWQYCSLLSTNSDN